MKNKTGEYTQISLIILLKKVRPFDVKDSFYLNLDKMI